MLIFLDIDGVMVPAQSWKRPAILNDGFPEFSAKAVNVLQELISEDVTVMLTTSHKSNYGIAKWKSIFKNRGIEITNLKSLEDNFNHVSRKDEIINWFNQNKNNESFIIIDDDKSLNNLPPNLKKNLILTSSMIGLVEEHKYLAQTIMNKFD
jgi:ATP-dependent helicase/DNAse subunit B